MSESDITNKTLIEKYKTNYAKEQEAVRKFRMRIKEAAKEAKQSGQSGSEPSSSAQKAKVDDQSTKVGADNEMDD
ncbi:hypothetical protein B9Z55_027883 [Caenorhabditis nigoni]|uniref:Uncharacterized protein n=1 Tax=Caenorhabditis nigoni TaxID=1611254 RepID=A0A2G5SDV0_9PELO|nr:hypothetical protein B9Z55_027883 [Caenorhabditis nigoni]